MMVMLMERHCCNNTEHQGTKRDYSRWDKITTKENIRRREARRKPKEKTAERIEVKDRI